MNFSYHKFTLDIYYQQISDKVSQFGQDLKQLPNPFVNLVNPSVETSPLNKLQERDSKQTAVQK